MQLGPPRWFAPLLGVTAIGIAAAAALVAIAAIQGPWELWGLTAALVILTATASAIALIGTRGLSVRDGVVTVTGIGSRSFDGDRLAGPLEQRLFGVRLSDGSASRRVFAQLPHLTATLVDRLPQYFPQLRSPVAFPVVLPGRIGTPVAYGVGAVMGVGMGGWATVQGVVGPGPDGPNRAVLLVVGAPMFVLGVGTLAWVLRRAERRVEVFADRTVHVHLLGRRTRALGPFAAAAVVHSPRKLPRSTLEREVHHLRRLDTAGGVVELAPMLAAFPDYGAAEGALMEARTRQLHRLHEVPQRPVELHRTRAGLVALWDHSESSPGAHRHTLLLPRPIGGRQVVPLLHGRVAVGGSIADAVASYDDRVLLLLDLAGGTVRHVVLTSPIRTLQPGYRRIGTADGPVDLATLAASATPGWPRRWGPLGVPQTPWIPALEAACVELGRTSADCPPLEALLAARAHESLIDLLTPWSDDPASPLLAPVLELARFDDPFPISRCNGSGRATTLGPDGRPECPGCGVATTTSPLADHEWPARGDRCDGSLRSPGRRHDDVLRGECRRCGTDVALTLHGLVRAHPAAAAV